MELFLFFTVANAKVANSSLLIHSVPPPVLWAGAPCPQNTDSYTKQENCAKGFFSPTNYQLRDLKEKLFHLGGIAGLHKADENTPIHIIKQIKPNHHF